MKNNCPRESSRTRRPPRASILRAVGETSTAWGGRPVSGKNSRARSDSSVSAIPSGPGFERLQRYETSIKRDMYRAIDRLELLQRRRKGEPPPPTVNVNVSSDTIEPVPAESGGAIPVADWGPFCRR
jgi:hypothetical protein